MKSYLEMNYEELIEEKSRVVELLRKNKNRFTIKQNKKYLSKIQKLLTEYERLKGE